MTKSLIEHLEAAETKDQLEELAKGMGVEINKRQGVETIRAELLEVAEARDQEKAASTDAKTGEGNPETEKSPDPESAKGMIKGDVEDSEPHKPYKGKMLKHTKNGRLFPWTAALAKSRYLKEV